MVVIRAESAAAEWAEMHADGEIHLLNIRRHVRWRRPIVQEDGWRGHLTFAGEPLGALIRWGATGACTPIPGEVVPIGGDGFAGVCGAAVVGGVTTWGVEVPVTPPIPLAA
jgi:hypothetical protein